MRGVCKLMRGPVVNLDRVAGKKPAVSTLHAVRRKGQDLDLRATLRHETNACSET